MDNLAVKGNNLHRSQSYAEEMRTSIDRSILGNVGTEDCLNTTVQQGQRYAPDPRFCVYYVDIDGLLWFLFCVQWSRDDYWILCVNLTTLFYVCVAAISVFSINLVDMVTNSVLQHKDRVRGVLVMERKILVSMYNTRKEVVRDFVMKERRDTIVWAHHMHTRHPTLLCDDLFRSMAPGKLQ